MGIQHDIPGALPAILSKMPSAHSPAQSVTASGTQGPRTGPPRQPPDSGGVYIRRTALEGRGAETDGNSG